MHFGVGKAAVPQQPHNGQSLPHQRPRRFPRPATPPFAGTRRMVGPTPTAAAARGGRCSALAQFIEGVKSSTAPEAAAREAVGKDSSVAISGAAVAVDGLVQLFTPSAAALPHAWLRRFGRPPSAGMTGRHHGLVVVAAAAS